MVNCNLWSVMSLLMPHIDVKKINHRLFITKYMEMKVGMTTVFRVIDSSRKVAIKLTYKDRKDGDVHSLVFNGVVKNF